MSSYLFTNGRPSIHSRNLGILKIELLTPTLLDQYNAGPSEVSLTIKPTTKIGILKKHNKKMAIARSKIRFRFRRFPQI